MIGSAVKPHSPALPVISIKHNVLPLAACHFSASAAVDYRITETKMSTALFKILIYLKRRPGMSTTAFRDYYEGVHSKFGEKYSDGLARYLRRYVEPLADDLVSHADALDFDVVTELWFEDRKAFDLVVKYAAHGRLPPEVIEDEARLFDRSKTRYITVVEHESTLPGR